MVKTGTGTTPSDPFMALCKFTKVGIENAEEQEIPIGEQTLVKILSVVYTFSVVVYVKEVGV
jgi:hypothetical protein